MYFGGKKLQMLGKVSFTAQCVSDGNIYGNFHVKASVIEDLKYHFDTHAIAGQAMTALLRGEHDNVSSCSAAHQHNPQPGEELFQMCPTPDLESPSCPRS